MPANGSDGSLSRRVASFARDELREPTEGLSGLLAQLSSEAEARSPGAYADDLAKTRAAAGNLRSLAAALAAEPKAEGDPSNGTRSLRTIRHDLRTPITAILGYGELVAEEAADRGDAWLADGLGSVLSGAAQLLKTIDRLAEIAQAGESRPPAEALAGAVPVLVREEAGRERAAPVADQPGRPIAGRILVVDDNASMRDLISRRLERQGHEVVSCAGGEAALELTARENFDLLMLDLLMPGVTGLEVLERLRARGGTPFPVIVMSALDDVEAAVRCIGAGADDYLSKPLDETLLKARIGSSLERKFLRDQERQTLRRLEAEQQRSDALLRNILPASVVQRLRAGETVIADQFETVTVLFCDLVGFTRLSARLEPAGTLRLLESIFSRFDALAEANGLEKIKTIGDAYMVVGGLGGAADGEAAAVLHMAQAMPGAVREARGDDALDVRIGIHTGPAVGGIIGTKKFFYDVWGDTVNLASRLEEACEPGRIHVSRAAKEAAGADFAFEARSPVELRGKGRVEAFYLRPN